jgi:hypothetical protein
LVSFLKLLSVANIRDAVLRGTHGIGFADPLLSIDDTMGSGLKGAVLLKK